MCYLPTRWRFLGHLRRSWKHFKSTLGAPTKMLPRLQTRSLSVHSITHRISFTSIPSLKGSFGTAVVVYPCAFAVGNALLPDAVTKQPTDSQAQALLTTPVSLPGKRGGANREPPTSLSPAPSGRLRFAAWSIKNSRMWEGLGLLDTASS